MVLDCLAHSYNLLCCKELCQEWVGSYRFTRKDVVQLPAVRKTRIVEGSDGVDHIYIDIVRLSEFKALRDDLLGVVDIVSLIKREIERKDIPLYILLKSVIYSHR